MNVLIDYNNIDQVTRNRGLIYVAERIANTLGPHVVGKYRRLLLRLYDGWYSSQTPTPLAQRIAVEIQRDFPKIVTVPNSSASPVKAVVAAEMAYSLHCDPQAHIWHTFRQRSGQANMGCEQPASVGCITSPCALANLPIFFGRGRCPSSSCTVTTEDLIVRNEQKLVDSMILTDLLSMHLVNSEELVVVSSDDDLWPGIRLVLQRGHKVFHIHTRPTHRTPKFYLGRIATGSYTQLNL